MRVLRAYHSAMLDARTDDLEAILDRHFSLAHITGYVQPKDEWFDVIRSGQFDYHTITVHEEAISMTVSGKTAIIGGRGLFDATINGMRRPWRLQFTMRFARDAAGWRILEARYTTF
jgi:hypothetical protein